MRTTTTATREVLRFARPEAGRLAHAGAVASHPHPVAPLTATRVHGPRPGCSTRPGATPGGCS